MNKLEIMAYSLMAILFIGGVINGIISFFSKIFYFGLIPGVVILVVLACALYVVSKHIKKEEAKKQK